MKYLKKHCTSVWQRKFSTRIKIPAFLRVGMVVLLLIPVQLIAQNRTVDVSTVVNYPDLSHTYHHGKPDSAVVTIHNNGPDKILRTDQYAIHFEYGSINMFPKFGQLYSEINPGDSLSMTFYFTLEFIGDVDSTEFCSYFTLYPITHGDTIFRSDGSQNKEVESCALVNFMDSIESSGIHQHHENRFALIQISTSTYRLRGKLSSTYNFRVINSSGQEIKAGLLNQDEQHIELETFPGIYFWLFEDTTTGKISYLKTYHSG